MDKSKNCVGKDNFERLNYLYQLSNIMQSKDGQNTSTLYSNLFISISKKAVQRVEPEIKRTICKKCHNVLLAGVSAKVRLRNKKLRWICNRCQITKVFKAVPDYQLWIQDPQSVVETLKY
ncbi:hypothetical protein ILUMI_06026 [Ignelater luminosus]|uniref:Uncharacterized protein n=1 Tax=Ignelater luminosus TaxID=2038154 RepID=A0A8K0D6K3_IGNLU|nr:hypothetical protein ILUMI_06026 [Ignelater luminosus]